MPYRSKICCACTCCRIDPTLHALREKLCQSNSSSVSTITSRNGPASFGYFAVSVGTIAVPLRLYGADAIGVRPSAGAIKGVSLHGHSYSTRNVSAPPGTRQRLIGRRMGTEINASYHIEASGLVTHWEKFSKPP